MATRPFQQNKQFRTDEQAGQMDQALVSVYTGLTGTSATYTGSEGLRNLYEKPGEPYIQTAQIRSSEQDDHPGVAVKRGYPDLQ